MPNFISEDTIEQAILKRLHEQFGFELLSCYTSDAADLNDRSGRSDKREVIFAERLKEAAKRLNTGITESAVDESLAKLTDRRYAMSAIAANREIDGG
jgi:type I restriction enzyme R subunit